MLFVYCVQQIETFNSYVESGSYSIKFAVGAMDSDVIDKKKVRNIVEILRVITQVICPFLIRYLFDK